MTDNKALSMAPINCIVDKSKELQKEILMEKLRSKTSQCKNLTETSKAVRMAILDKRWALDSADRMILQKCLDSLQHCIKVSSLQSLIERLECLSRQLGLKFVVGASGVTLFISSDMFYLEIVVDATGAVKDVKIHHEGKCEQQSCEELVSCISRGDFADFTAQLEGLTAVYQLNAEKKVKCKAFSALQSLEEDLFRLACEDMRQLPSFAKDLWAQVHKSPVGFLQKRRGGHAMRLTYFVSPYELLDREKGLQPLSGELLTAGRAGAGAGPAALAAPRTPLGHSVSVLLEGSAPNKLQLAPIITVGQRTAKGGAGAGAGGAGAGAGAGGAGPAYAPLVPQNSALLPACFALKLSQPMPLCASLAKLIYATTEIEIAGDWANATPMLGLVAQQAYNKLTPGKNVELNLSKGLFVTLPEQTQCYFLCEARGGAAAVRGRAVASVPFTHPAHVPPLLAALRQQALFNTLVASCVRPQHKNGADVEGALMFEVSALSAAQLSVSLEWPPDEALGTLELALAEPGAPRAALHALRPLQRARADRLDEYVTRVLQATHSIPITLRALIKVWEREAATKKMNGNYSSADSNFNSGMGGIDPGGEHDAKPEPGAHPRTLYPSSVSHPHQGGSYLSDQQHHMSVMCQEPSAGDAKPQGADDRRAKKRKSDDMWSSQRRYKCSASDAFDSANDSDSECYGNDDDVTMHSNSSNDRDDMEGGESSVSQNEFVSDVELSGAEGPPGAERAPSDADNSNDGDADDIIRNSFHKPDHKRQKLKNKDSDVRSGRASSLLMDLTEGKSYMPSSVSITPLGAAGAPAPAPASASAPAPAAGISSMLCLNRRPGIEIIPITAAAPAALPSSITITPISSSQLKSHDDRNKLDRKSSKSGEERGKEKKKKRRREDPMGPPEKVPPKQDPLTKPVSISIKPTDGSPLRPTSPNSLLRKFSPSPTHGRSVSITKSPSPSSLKGLGKPSGTSSHHNSPRHSPVQNSPKHLSGYSSPKNHSISSPKHSSSGSGKPSMSALKSAASGSPSGKSGTTGYDLSKKSSKDGGYSSSSSTREKEKKHSSLSFSSSGRSSPKLKNPMKLKQLEITPISCDAPVNEPLISPPNVEVNKSNAPSQNRNRKGSLSAVIDKLKSAQHCGTDIDPVSAKSSGSPNKFSDSKNSMSSSTKTSESKNQEYMVKPSLDGMKITINKTKSKESSSGSSKLNYSSSVSSKQSSSQLTPPSQGSPKTHTGLKPGVISGPASKKTQVMQSSKSSGLTPGSTPPKANLSPSESSSNLPKVPYSKSSSTSSTGINLSKSASKTSSGSPKSNSADFAKIIRDKEREKVKSQKSNNSEKSLFSSKSERHSSPSGSRDEVDGDRYKASVKDANPFSQVEGLIKPLNTSFQIPKLKNQNTPDKNSPVSQYDRSLINDFARSLDQNKYPFPHYDTPNARNVESIQKSAYPLNVPKPLLNMGSLSPKTVPPGKMDQSDRSLEYSKAITDSLSRGESPQRSKDDSKEAYQAMYPLMPLDFKTDMVKGFPVPKGSSEDRKGADSSMKPPASASVARSGATTPQEAELLLDYSSSSGSKVSGMVALRPVYPASPALALQLAKSPAPSPHSNSPCITDDELMDEAVVGPGK